MNFFKEYFNLLNGKIYDIDIEMLKKASQIIQSVRSSGGKVIIVGNGGSAAIASHVSVDMTNCCKIRAINFNEADLLTCFSNDYGYEGWVVKALQFYADPEDLIIFISSSGASKNIINGAKEAKIRNLKMITFSGFSIKNPLRKLGDLNFWVDSKVYNIIELTHNAWLSAIIDFIREDKVMNMIRKEGMSH